MALRISSSPPKFICARLFKPRAGSDGLREEVFEFLDGIESSGGLNVGDFPMGLEWLNSKPLSVKKELKGKLLLLDFWTYCCINCMHVLPDLAYLEDKYASDAFAVVGVHSAKFDNEQLSSQIRAAVLRYDISHPVVNDPDMRLWQRLGIDSWPTFALVSPRSGKLIAKLSGEGHRSDLDALIPIALDYYAQDLDARPVPVVLERDKDARAVSSALRFPGKIAVDADGGRLFIADSNNHRIVVTDLDGKFLQQVGAAVPGLVDGDAATAQFNRPQGVAYDQKRRRLFVADTENHALRSVDVDAGGTVRTLAGTGEQGYDRVGGGKGREQVLSSPWDVVVRDDVVLVAMAGLHQIWAVDLNTGVVKAVAGSGRELNANSSVLSQAAFAQPSGLTVAPQLDGSGENVYIADSESSSVRSLSFQPPRTETIVGGDPFLSANLFAFGDVDGVGAAARLQHPLAVLAISADTVAVADSYNHKIKLLDLRRAAISTLAGSGAPGYRDGDPRSAEFAEPAGLAVSPDGRVLYVADTNNNAIRTVDLASGQVSSLDLSSVPAAAPLPSADSRNGVTQRLTSSRATALAGPALGSGSQRCVVRMSIPTGYKPTADAQSKWQAFAVTTATGAAATSVEVTPRSGELRWVKAKAEGVVAQAEVEVEVKTRGDAAGTAVEVVVEALGYYCRDGGGKSDLCLMDSVRWTLPVERTAAPRGDAPAVLEYILAAK